jgi:hypothetical protein
LDETQVSLEAQLNVNREVNLRILKDLTLSEKEDVGPELFPK